jgi:hypothetical protein
MTKVGPASLKEMMLVAARVARIEVKKGQRRNCYSLLEVGRFRIRKPSWRTVDREEIGTSGFDPTRKFGVQPGLPPWVIFTHGGNAHVSGKPEAGICGNCSNLLAEDKQAVRGRLEPAFDWIKSGL